MLHFSVQRITHSDLPIVSAYQKASYVSLNEGVAHSLKSPVTLATNEYYQRQLWSQLLHNLDYTPTWGVFQGVVPIGGFQAMFVF